MTQQASEMRLHDPKGQRLYIDDHEHDRFAKALETFEPTDRTLLMTYLYTGCRATEALQLCPDRVELNAKELRFRTLKKHHPQGKVIAPQFRTIPVPSKLLNAIDLVYGITRRKNSHKTLHKPLWPMTRGTAYRKVKACMIRADIIGPQANIKGLRHGFAVRAIKNGVPLNMLQIWLGHSQITTTAIYANAQGREARQLASLMWN